MAKTNDAFSALSLKDRAELINIYVKGGMMDLKEIKAHYNSLYEEKEPNKYGWGGASKEALGKAFGNASSAASSVTGIAGSAMTMVDNFMKNSEVDTTEADNALEATKSHQLDPSGLDALSSSYNATPWADTDVDFENFLPSTSEYISNTLSSTVSGLATGAQVGGPWGAVIGGVVGLGSAVGGIFAGREKAKLEEARLEAAAKKANTAIENKAIDARNNIIQQQTNGILRNVAADGGRLNKFGPGGHIETDEYGYPADITPVVVEADYPRENEVWKRADASNADMVQRLRQGSSRVTIPDWEDPRKVATHKMMSAGKYAIGNVQNINGQLFDFTDPKHGFKDPDRAAIDSAIKRGDYVEFDTEGDARYFAEHYKKHYNSFGDGGDTNGDEKTSFWKRLLEFGQSARDARIGAVGAQQVRDLYNEGKTEEASELAKKYAKANTTGIALTSGIANTGLLGDLLTTGATTTIDTLIDGEVNKLGINTVKNVAADVIGHGITKGINKYNRIKGLKESYTGVPHKGTYKDPHIAMDENFPNYNGTIWTSDSQELAREYAKDNGRVFKVLVEPDKLQMVETPIPSNGEYFPWGYLPYKLENGKIKMTDSELVDSAIFANIKDGLEHSKLMVNPNRTSEQVRKSYSKSLKGRAGKTTTDDIVNASYEQGFDGVNFNGVYDGYRMIEGYPVDAIVNESVYNPHVPHIVLPENKSKWSLFFKNMDKLMVLENGGKLIKKCK